MPAKIAALSAGLAVLLVLPSTVQAKTFTPIPSGQFQLVKQGFGKRSSRQVRQLARAYPRTGLNHLLGDTNRVNTPVLGASSPRGAFGYSWESGDNGVDYWTPQGITGNGAGVQAVSWYRGESGSESGVRVSFVNRAEGAHGEYRFALLVNPTGGQNFEQVGIHAGGIAWAGRYLYVADTGNGIRAFDLARTLRVPDDRLPATGNYRYLLPQVGRYRSSGGLKFSALALDRSNPGHPALVAGEYQVYEKGDPRTRIARWPLNPKTKLLARRGATGAWRTGFDQLQGVITSHGRIFVSSTEGPRGFLYHGRPRRKAQRDRWGLAPEGLYATKSQLWTATEAKDRRTVFGKTFGSLLRD